MISDGAIKMVNGLPEAGKFLAVAALVWILSAVDAMSAPGHPEPWQIGFQDAVTPIARQLDGFHNFLLIIITLITLFVLGLLVYAMFRFREKVHPKPAKFTHNTPLEVAWTVIPVLILVMIAIPSFRLLFAQYDFPKADLTIKATGSQWYWSYEYPDHDNMVFDSIMVEDEDLKPGQPRLLTVDNDIVVPVNKNVHMLVTATDVIHSWTIPSFGVKVDAVPGRLVRAWFRAEQTGIYYGQCSELCGVRHAFMPITVRVVSEQEFAIWLESAKKKFASIPPGHRDGDQANGARKIAANSR